MFTWMHPLCFGCGVRHSKDTPCPDGTKWFQGRVVCRVCSYAHQAVMPIRPGDDNPPHDLECPRCQGMTCDPEPAHD
jgi:hypothetical protein